MAAKPTIAIVGPGNLGSALANSLRSAGFTILEIISRDSRTWFRKSRALPGQSGARHTTPKNARLDADVIWLCVPDREIAAAARLLAPRTGWKGKVALHSSGAAVASLHPLMTFVRGSQPRLAGVPFAVEGDAKAVRVARRIVRDLKGDIFSIPKDKKAAYHTWGAFTSPLLLAALVTAEEVAGIAGISRARARKKSGAAPLRT